MVDRVGKLLVVACSDLGHAVLAVEAGTDGFVGLYELVKLSGEFLVLNGDDANMVVERIDLNLQVRVVVEERRVAVSCAFELLAHVHDLVFLGANLRFKVFDAGRQFDISGSLAIDTLLEVSVLVAVLVLEGLEVVELVLEADDLILELDDLAFALNELGLLALEVEGLRIDELVQIINARQLLLDVHLEGPRLSSQVRRLAALHLVRVVELVDLLGVLSVALAEVVELLLEVLLLGNELRVEILVLGEVGLEFGDLGVSAVEDVLLRVELSVQIGVLLFAVDQQVLLIIDFLAEGADHVDIGLDTTFVVVLHAALLVGDAVEVLLESEQLVLEELVLALSGPEFHGLSAELGDQTILVVLGNGGIVQLSFRAVGHVRNI